MRHVSTLQLVIANGAQNSGALSAALSASTDSAPAQLSGARAALASATAIVIYSPAALTGNITVYVQPRGSSTWYEYIPGGQPQTFGAGGAFPVAPGFSDLRLESSAAEGAARTFIVELQEDMD